MGRIIKGIFDIPAVVYSSIHGGPAKFATGFQHDLPERHLVALICNKSSITTVLALFKTGCPPAIFLAVSEIIIDAFYCHFWRWARSHVTVKNQKILPFIRDEDSSAAITIESGFVWIVASINYATPDSMLWRIVHPMFRYRLPVITSAGFRNRSLQILGIDDSRFSAIALTIPQRVTPSSTSIFNHDQSIEAHAAQVVYSMVRKRNHGMNSIMIGM